jgi:hypothetical protein
LFFQVVLLLGYLYAHLLTKSLRPGAQVWIHVTLIAASLLVLPILPKDSWKPTGVGDPTIRILVLLVFTAGLPYFLLSSTSPLLQAWYSQSREHAAPYRFYALSNVGSLLALLSYPVLVEPHLSSAHQAAYWSIAYAGVAILCAVVSIVSRSRIGEVPVAETTPRPAWQTQLLWIGLAACGSALLLAVTNHVSQNIAAVPFLWVIPLSLYLLSFILCFDGRGWYRRGLFLRLLGISLGGMIYALTPSYAGLPWSVLIPLYCCGLFVCCMFCHGELVRLKPSPEHLTSFYLMVSLGGAIGAVFVALVAPRVFSGYYELQIAMGCCALLVLVVLRRDPGSKFYRARWQPAWLGLVGVVLIAIVSLFVTGAQYATHAKVIARNFYGVLRVIDEGRADAVDVKDEISGQAGSDLRFRKLMNGTIEHGLQFLAPSRRREPTAYYGPNSGVGVALRAAGTRNNLRVGVIGLGVGTLAAYGRAGDAYTFYEINPLVIRVANQYFTFLGDAAANSEIVLGDARISLERETPRGFDVLVVDAFSGDSIPVHLLTREAFALYFWHLKPDGVLAVHISNQYLNLQPVVEGAATKLGKEAVVVNFGQGSNQSGIYPATWLLVGDPRGFLGKSEIEKAGRIHTAGIDELVWTDDYSSLFSILK